MTNQNTLRGVLLAAIALFFLVQAPHYSIGSLGRAGPGLFPAIVASLLLVIAVVMIARSRFIEAVPLDLRFRNAALVAGSLIAFTVISQYGNMFAAIVVMTTMASLASDDFTIPRTAAIAGTLCLIAVAMKTILGVQLPLY